MGRSFLVTMCIGMKSSKDTIRIVFREVSGQRALPPNPTSGPRTHLSRYNPTQPSRPRLKVLGVICMCLHVSLSALVLYVLFFLYLRLCVCV